MLAREAGEITLQEIIRATEGDLLLVECSSKGRKKTGCEFDGVCVTQSIWQEAAARLSDYFGTLTLKDLCDRGESMGVSREQDLRFVYHI